jgi:hypothetical protein
VILTLATNDAGVNNAIENLKTKTNEEKEYGYEIKYSYNMDTRQYEYETIYKTSGDDFTVALNIGGFIQGGAHNHPKDGVAIPS